MKKKTTNIIAIHEIQLLSHSICTFFRIKHTLYNANGQFVAFNAFVVKQARKGHFARARFCDPVRCTDNFIYIQYTMPIMDGETVAPLSHRVQPALHLPSRVPHIIISSVIMRFLVRAPFNRQHYVEHRRDRLASSATTDNIVK